MGISTGLLRTSLTAEPCARTQMFETGRLSVLSPRAFGILAVAFFCFRANHPPIQLWLMCAEPQQEPDAAAEVSSMVAVNMRKELLLAGG